LIATVTGESSSERYGFAGRIGAWLPTDGHAGAGAPRG